MYLKYHNELFSTNISFMNLKRHEETLFLAKQSISQLAVQSLS